MAAVIWDISYYSGQSSLLKHVLNGWTLSPIVTLSSGLPFTVSSGKDNNYDGTNNDRANVVGNPFLDPNRSRAPSDGAMVQYRCVRFQSIGSPGNSARNLMDAPGVRNVDLGIFRNIAFQENIRL